jgi:hypothetical protein
MTKLKFKRALFKVALNYVTANVYTSDSNKITVKIERAGRQISARVFDSALDLDTYIDELCDSQMQAYNEGACLDRYLCANLSGWSEGIT